MIAVPAAALALAACSPAASPGTSPPASPAPAATAATVPPPPARPAAPVRYSANITAAAADGALAGPEKLTFTSCGKLTPAQQSQFKFTNEAAFAAFPQVSVNFLDGSTVVASNVSDSGATPVSPGESEAGEVDTGQVGPQPPFTSCEVMGYLLVSARGSVPVRYAG
jgi:hypothetical protein